MPDDPTRVPVEDWMQTPVSDSADYLDRDRPQYIRPPEPIVEEPDAADPSA